MTVPQKLENYLGLDWGERKVGVALAHGETGVAVAYATYPNDESLLPKLRSLIESENIDALIIGVPQWHESSSLPHPSRVFGQQLSEALGLPVHFVNEIFSTRLATQHLAERGSGGSGADDTEAARILLGEWLERR